MSKLPNLKPREVEAILLRAGFIRHAAKSGHRTYYRAETHAYTVVAFHPGTIPQGTLRAIIRQANMSPDEFLSYRKK